MIFTSIRNIEFFFLQKYRVFQRYPVFCVLIWWLDIWKFFLYKSIYFDIFINSLMYFNFSPKFTAFYTLWKSVKYCTPDLNCFYGYFRTSNSCHFYPAGTNSKILSFLNSHYHTFIIKSTVRGSADVFIKKRKSVFFPRVCK